MDYFSILFHKKFDYAVPLDGKYYEALFSASSGGEWSETTITGTTPIYFKSNGDPLTDYLISGNTSQSGTPSPDAPVDVQGCGVRTAQLFEDKIVRCNIDASGRLVQNSSFSVYIAKVEQGVTYTASAPITGGFFIAKPTLGSTSYDGQRLVYVSPKITAPITGYMVFRVDIGSDEPMFNLGSTALPREPYGYKLPPTVNGTEYPIYLGQVESTRRIKKLVLYDTKDYSFDSDRSQITFTVANGQRCIPYCSHYIGKLVNSWSELGNGYIAFHPTYSTIIRICDTTITSVEDFKSYLAAQYANGTPVTIWYVLDEPETGIVNEPLMKIGDCADTLSMAQSGVTIPTSAGANTLTVGTTVQPSEVSITGNIRNIKEVST